jgi:hypothetical protein
MVSIGPMNREEILLAIGLVIKDAGISLSNVEKESIADKLDNDPFLIGLFSQLIEASTSIDLIKAGRRCHGERFINHVCLKDVS